MTNDKWNVHGRVDGPIPEAKLREFQSFARTTASKPAKSLDAAVVTPVKSKRPRDTDPDGIDKGTPSPKPVKARSAKDEKEAVSTWKKMKREAKAKKQAEKPKRTPNAYSMFFTEQRSEIVASLGAVANPMIAAAKKAGEMWKALAEEGQKVYKERATKAREEALSKAAEKSCGGDSRPDFLEAVGPVAADGDTE